MTYENLPLEYRQRLEAEKICAIKYSNAEGEHHMILLKRGDHMDISRLEGYQVSSYIKAWYDFSVLAPMQREGMVNDDECLRQVKEVLEIFE